MNVESPIDSLTDQYTIRPYRSGDEGEIVELLQKVFDDWPHFDLECTSLDHWRWKYQDNPFKGNFIVVGVDNDKIIGFEHSFPINIKVGDRVLLCTYAGDTGVHPDFRVRGVWKNLLKMNTGMRENAGVKYNYLVTRNPILIDQFMRSKDFHLFPWPIANLVRIKDINEQLRAMPVKNAWFIKLGFHVSKLFNQIINFRIDSESKLEDVTISEINIFDDRIDDFWKEVSDHYDFIVERRKNYLNWRYCDKRGGDFIVLQAECGGQVLGYTSLRINNYRKNYAIGYILDLLTLPGRLDVADALVAEAIGFFDRKDINIVNCQMIKGCPYERVLNRYGFLNSRINIKLFFNPLGEEDILDKLDKITSDKVYISWGDQDALPIKIPPYT